MNNNTASTTTTTNTTTTTSDIKGNVTLLNTFKLN
jgi:hypothetical protein